MMEKAVFTAQALELWQGLDLKFKPDNQQATEEITSKMVFDEPIFGIANAKDYLFQDGQESTVIGPRYMLPTEWLPGTLSVVCYFLPYTKQIKQACLQAPDKLQQIEKFGTRIIKNYGEKLSLMLVKQGEATLVPANDIRFTTIQESDSAPYANWSERYAAYIAGLGNFTPQATMNNDDECIGQLGSIVTNLMIEADASPANENYQNNPADEYRSLLALNLPQF